MICFNTLWNQDRCVPPGLESRDITISLDKRQNTLRCCRQNIWYLGMFATSDKNHTSNTARISRFQPTSRTGFTCKRKYNSSLINSIKQYRFFYTWLNTIRWKMKDGIWTWYFATGIYFRGNEKPFYKCS